MKIWSSIVPRELVGRKESQVVSMMTLAEHVPQLGAEKPLLESAGMCGETKSAGSLQCIMHDPGIFFDVSPPWRVAAMCPTQHKSAPVISKQTLCRPLTRAGISFSHAVEDVQDSGQPFLGPSNCIQLHKGHASRQISPSLFTKSHYRPSGRC